MVVLSASKFMRVTGLRLVVVGCVVTVRPPHATHTFASRAVNCATALGRSSRLGLSEADHSEPLAPCPAALPHAAILGAAVVTLRSRRIHTTDAPRFMMLPLPSHRHHVHADPLHLCAVVAPVRVASAACTWASRRRLVI